jgi:hypothetical protein
MMTCGACHPCRPAWSAACRVRPSVGYLLHLSISAALAFVRWFNSTCSLCEFAIMPLTSANLLPSRIAQLVQEVTPGGVTSRHPTWYRPLDPREADVAAVRVIMAA